MRLYKDIQDGYICGIGQGYGGTEITESEYLEIVSVLNNMPEAPEGYGYKLKTDLTWELYELPPAPEPQPSQDWLDGYDQAILDMMEVQ